MLLLQTVSELALFQVDLYPSLIYIGLLALLIYLLYVSLLDLDGSQLVPIPIAVLSLV